MSITIKYRTRKDHCKWCDQKLHESKTSEVRERNFTKGNLLEWTDDWKEIAEFEEDLQECVREFVYETISFFATSHEDRLLIENSEFDKVKQFILDEVVA